MVQTTLAGAPGKQNMSGKMVNELINQKLLHFSKEINDK